MDELTLNAAARNVVSAYRLFIDINDREGLWFAVEALEAAIERDEQGALFDPEEVKT